MSDILESPCRRGRELRRKRLMPVGGLPCCHDAPRELLDALRAPGTPAVLAKDIPDLLRDLIRE